MRRPFAVLALSAMVLLAAPRAAVAQITGLPVVNSGIASGLTIGGEIGFPNTDYGKGTAYGGRAALGLGPFGVSAVVAKYNPKGPGTFPTAYGLAANFKVFGGPLVPFSVTLQGGAERASDNSGKVYHFPVGLGIAVKIPNPALAIKPWIAPRLDVLYADPAVGTTSTDKNFGISGGVDFSLLGGLGFGVAYDRVFADNSLRPSTLSVGARYTLKIPGL
jgi:hypothetical protein